jgi:hypothetical protein
MVHTLESTEAATESGSNGAITGAQLKSTSMIAFSTEGFMLDNPLPFTYEKGRTMMKDPTIALASSVVTGPIAGGEWGVEADDDTTQSEGKIDFVKEELVERRQEIVESILSGILRFGWAAFEKVFYLRADGKIGISPLKPLLHDITGIRIVKDTGAFAGFVQSLQGVTWTVPLEASLLVPWKVEGTHWYGNGLLANAMAAYDAWTVCNLSASRYDEKLAGTMLVLHYPKDEQSNVEGVMVDNQVIAKTILDNWKSSGKVAMPSSMENEEGWKIELLSDANARQASFNDRLQYLDIQKMRAWTVPERAAMEGRFGTKAEAETHVDVWTVTLELIDQFIARMLNWHLVDQLLALNWGHDARGTVRLVPAPINAIEMSMMRALYNKVLDSSVGFAEVFPTIDTEVMQDQLNIPTKEPDALIPLPIITAVPQSDAGNDDVDADPGDGQDGDS